MGGSISGILSARILADSFDKVIIIEKDNDKDLAQLRKSVPQGGHVNVLLDTGIEIMEELFPNLINKLQQNGGHILDGQNDVAWYHFGVWKKRYRSRFKVSLQGRPFLENFLRESLLDQCSNVTLLTGTKVTGLTYNKNNHRITGVEINNNENINGDFIINAMGRLSPCMKWLNAYGIETPEKSTIDIGMGYTTAYFKKDKISLEDSKALFVHPYPPYNTKYGIIVPQEKNKDGEEVYMVSLSGCLGDHAKTNFVDFLDFAKQLDNDKIYKLIKNTKPISDITYYKSNLNVRYFFEKIQNPPKGLISIGDTVLTPNPIYGQGMTIAALETKALESALQNGIEKRFYKKIEPIIDFAWDVTSGENFRYPQVEGKRSLKLIMQNIYTKHLFLLTENDIKVWHTFTQVLLFKKHPITLFNPTLLFKVLVSKLKRRG